MLKAILLPKSLGPLLIAIICALSNLMIFIYFITFNRWSLFPWLTVPGFNPTNCSLMTLYAVNSIHSVYFFAALFLIVSEFIALVLLVITKPILAIYTFCIIIIISIIIIGAGLTKEVFIQEDLINIACKYYSYNSKFLIIIYATILPLLMYVSLWFNFNVIKVALLMRKAKKANFI